jgi:tetratricopeptide (TPR) repeat protein
MEQDRPVMLPCLFCHGIRIPHPRNVPEVSMSTARSMFLAVILIASCTAVTMAAEPNYKELYKIGVQHNKKGEFNEAIGYYTKAIALKPDVAPLYFVRGRAYVQAKNYDNAISDLTAAIKLKPDYAEAYNFRGIAYSAKKEKPASVADFKKACDLGLKESCSNMKK